MPRSVSSTTDPSMTMRPWSGRISPAIALTTEVFPAPERPNSAVRPGPLRKCASSVKSPSETLRQKIGGKQRNQRQRDRNEREAQRADVAARGLGQRVDRRRDGPRLARNVRYERDRRAELAEAAGKRQHHTGDDAGGDQR